MIKFPPKRIMAAFDLSDVSRAAWRHAEALAARCGAELEAVYCEPWQPGPEMMPPPALSPGRVRAQRARIRALIGAGPKITILQGDPAARVLSLAARRRPDLIVVGTHGRKGFMRAMLGSTSEAIVRGAPVPVLVARGPSRPVRSILAPVNFTSYSEYGFSYAAAAAAVLGARLTALHVDEDPAWSGNSSFRLSRFIHRLPAPVLRTARPRTVSAAGDPVREILKAKRGHDWIVLVAHEKSLIKDAFFGTTLERVLRSSSIPLLSVPVPGRVPFALRAAGARSLTLT